MTPTLSLLVWCAVAPLAAAPPDVAPPDARQADLARRAQIESDWLLQEARRGAPSDSPALRPQDDAAGGCDGVKDGGYGFHTDIEEGPWWQVDLGRQERIAQVQVYNRCGALASRAATLRVLASGDGRDWSEVYRHDGREFHGFTDGRPLVVATDGLAARYVRVQLGGRAYLHLDELEVYRAGELYERNIALGRPASQSSVSQWSTRATGAGSHAAGPAAGAPSRATIRAVLQRGRALAASFDLTAPRLEDPLRVLSDVGAALERDAAAAEPARARDLFFAARWAAREIALANPLLGFERLLFVKRVPGSYSHMSDQYYGWFSRPGGGLYVLEGFKGARPSARCLTGELPPGSVLRPDLSFDGTRALFAYARFHEGLASRANKLDKSSIPEDAFYQLYEVRLDGGGLRRLTRGEYDHFDARYLPDGDIVFLSTRRGQSVQCVDGSPTDESSPPAPDSYVRCGGGARRPVAVYTLHILDSESGAVRAISPFENFEWTPSVANDGRILYARWDYVDRDNMPYMSLWSTLPDGTSAQAVYGNYTSNPYSVFEARSVPGSQKLVFTASAHHSITGGSLVLLDPARGTDGEAPLSRLTPEVPFPESERWPSTYYANPWPLSEEHFLVAWSATPLVREGRANPPNALGLYAYHASGHLELLYRDPDISSMYPIPIRRRAPAAEVASPLDPDTMREGSMLVLDVHHGLEGTAEVRSLRIVGVPPKTQPTMNDPPIGLTRDDPGKFVIGTVPVEADGSAHFRVPAGTPFFLQALDADGMAVQTMRSVTYVQQGQTLACIGCHEHRHLSPANRSSDAARRPPSPITPGPDGSWPLDFSRLVGPVLERHCVACHGEDREAHVLDLDGEAAYESLVAYGGGRSAREHVLTRYRQGRSVAGRCASRTSPLLELLDAGHYHVDLPKEDLERLITWLDTYAQRRGSFSEDQERRLRDLRERLRPILTDRSK